MKDKLHYTNLLYGRKNLLGFSGGSDSVALFFTLLEMSVEFDLAIIDYGVREQSKEELAYAKEIAKIHNKRCFYKLAPTFKGNFETKAREFRYLFFKEIMITYHYENLLLAHHLNDRFEWFLMQFSKGAGLDNLLGFEGVEQCEWGCIIRPMLWIDKDMILEFCKVRGYKFFEDKSNLDMTFLRNFIRYHFATPYIRQFKQGVQKSLTLLSNEKDLFYPHNIKHFGEFFIFSYQEGNKAKVLNLHCVDICLKKLGYVLSIKQREEIYRTHFSCEIGGKSKRHSLYSQGFLIEKINNSIIVCQAKPPIKLPKDFREIARIWRIPVRLRNVFYRYICMHNLTYEQFLHSLPL